MLNYLYFFSSGGHFCLAEWNRLGKFGRGSYKGHFCEIILNLEQSSRDVILKYSIYIALVVILFGGAKPFKHIFVQGIMRKISAKLF